MSAKQEITSRCESLGRHKGTRKVESHTYPWAFDGKYLRLCRQCWNYEDSKRGIKRGTAIRKAR